MRNNGARPVCPALFRELMDTQNLLISLVLIMLLNGCMAGFEAGECKITRHDRQELGAVLEDLEND